MRIVRFLLLAAALTTLAAAEVQAQSGVTESWRDSAGNWTGRKHALDPAGNLLVVGDTVVGDIIQVRKISPAGQLLWSRIYDPAERVVSYWIATDFAGNAWIAAARITGSQNSRVGFLVLKYDAQGNLLFVDATAGGLAVPGIDMPSASPTHAIVFAVYMPAHEPVVGHAARSTAVSSSSVIVPFACAPTASNTSWIVTSRPW